MRALYVGRDAQFDKDVALQMLSSLNVARKSLKASELILELNRNQSLIERLPDGMLLFPHMQKKSYCASILNYLIAKEFVTNPEKNTSRTRVKALHYSITQKGKNALQNKDAFEAPELIKDAIEIG